jgi:Holliday junction resolvasome RuvABC ATP-dependent DNA helicase subunit
MIPKYGWRDWVIIMQMSLQLVSKISANSFTLIIPAYPQDSAIQKNQLFKGKKGTGKKLAAELLLKAMANNEIEMVSAPVDSMVLVKPKDLLTWFSRILKR